MKRLFLIVVGLGIRGRRNGRGRGPTSGGSACDKKVDARSQRVEEREHWSAWLLERFENDDCAVSGRCERTPRSIRGASPSPQAANLRMRPLQADSSSAFDFGKPRIPTFSRLAARGERVDFDSFRTWRRDRQKGSTVTSSFSQRRQAPQSSAVRTGSARTGLLNPAAWRGSEL